MFVAAYRAVKPRTGAVEKAGAHAACARGLSGIVSAWRRSSEVRPLVEALNQLFQRTHNAMLRERRFTSDAAHELRSPLAALKVQTDVAQLSMDDAEGREKALAQLHQGIDQRHPAGRSTADAVAAGLTRPTGRRAAGRHRRPAAVGGDGDVSPCAAVRH